jgi:putative tRNA adenosine deaminase-associated protein
VAHFSAVFAKSENGGWVGIEVDLTEVVIPDDVVDLMREAAVEAGADTAVLLVERDDDWFAVARTDEESDARIFLSDSRSILTSEPAAVLYETIGRGEEPTADPSGDPELLEDLGVTAVTLNTLSDSSPAGDALLAIAERVGFGEEYERLR